MKKFALGFVAVLTLVVGTYAVPASVSANSGSTPSKETTKAKTVDTAFIPPPSCPPNDPNGCGIYD